MERKMILASHGKFASGILSSLELICGKNANIQTLDCYITEDFDLTKAVDALMQQNEDAEVVVVTDLFGGSVNNEFLRYINKEHFYLVAGMNLPFLIEFATQFTFVPDLKETIATVLSSSKEAIQFCNLTYSTTIAEEDF
ncbi:PTS mannose transporter subunit IIA [Enterococcus sp. MJM12]|uniref:PTS mannose transporter subunit IIA n=1 Tax=Candidatus Enterococcus myersii TaxID=2815322 RepID=A0ABS3H5W3_9ENTE|nr:PTS mannose transporter subunit IIA [Enterococcus sp. MJM12]MBO0448379.1 PTS mannose transporter subunit IIA [Enterococcus sp. MJM12]